MIGKPITLLKKVMFIIGVFICSVLHEMAHGLTAKAFGYKFVINIGFPLFTTSFPEPIIVPRQLFWVILMPYLVELFLAIILFVLYKITRKRIFFFLSVIPLLDMALNMLFALIAIKMGMPNDFLALLSLPT